MFQHEEISHRNLGFWFLFTSEPAQLGSRAQEGREVASDGTVHPGLGPFPVLTVRCLAPSG